MKLGVVGGSSLVSFDPTDEFAAIGLTISSKKDITVETPHGKVRLRIVELTGAAFVRGAYEIPLATANATLVWE